MKIAIIGGGEVGRAYAEALATRSGHTPILCTPRPKPEALQLAEAHGIDIVTEAGTWLGDVDRVWICVTGDIASSVCRELLEHLKPGVVLIDLTTATPEDKRRSFAAAAERGVEYVDAVILGAVALTKAQTPLLAAGLSAQAFMSEFVELGAPLRVLPRAHAGDAAALKLLRTILTKGLESLAVECLVAADRQGVRSELYDAMSDVDEVGFASFLDMLVRTHVQHSERRMHEVERAEEQLAGMGLPSFMLAASQRVFERTTQAAAAHRPPAAATTDISEALKWLSATAGPARVGSS